MLEPLPFKIKLFADGAHYSKMVELSRQNQITGFTTNPSLMRQSGIKNYRTFCKELLLEIPDKPISFEVFADDFTDMSRQAYEIASWAKNVYVKIPISNCSGLSSGSLIRELSQKGVQVNVTAILTLPQVRQASEALQGGAPSIISVFAGRIADTGRDPEPMMREASEICRVKDKNIELLWASTRELLNIIHAERTGCHIITVTHEQLAKLHLIGNDLAQYSLETVRTFKKDADAAGYQL